MLNIRGLKAAVDGQAILKGINLEVKPGEFMPLWDQMAQVRVRCLMFLPVVMITMLPMEGGLFGKRHS